jgi:hypothetical protein
MKSKELNSNEYHPFYKTYIESLENVELIDVLTSSSNELISILDNLSEEKFNYSYDIGKWTIKELLQHLIDTERIMSYRALRFSRNDTTILQGFDENIYVENCNANKRNSKELIDEFKAVRTATLLLFNSFDTSMLLKMGNANNSGMSVRALGFMIAGHVLHHLKIIKERYL